jgi:hypothetical protein
MKPNLKKIKNFENFTEKLTKMKKLSTPELIGYSY